MPADTELMEKLTALCKRRGFIYPGSEIYGGIGGFWDYGPLGVELKRNIKDIWWHDMVTNPPDGPDGKEITMVGIDAALIMNPKVWEASGHVGGFSDPMVDCKECQARLRADQVFVAMFRTDPPKKPDPNEFEKWSDEWAAEMEEAISAPKSEENRRHIEELQRIYRGRLAPYAPQVAKSVEAGTTDEAGGSAVLTSRERKLVGDVQPYWVLPIRQFQLFFDKSPCPVCGAEKGLTEPRAFSLMLETAVGALRDRSSITYLRPETAQGIFVNWPNVLDTQRVKLPFGIAQVGKAFRNEINPRNYTFRSREFEQMEIEFFCRGSVGVPPARNRQDAGATLPPAKGELTDMEWYEFWRKVRFDWYVNLGLNSEKLRLRDQTADELAHYSKCCADIEYLFPFSDEFQELEGVAHRGCYDLEQHAKHSGRDLSYFDDELWQQDAHKYKDDKNAAKKAKEGPPYRFLPTVIEPSAGVDRSALAFLCEAYTEDEAPDEKGVMQKRVVMKFHPKIAPIKAAFFPLVNRAGMPELAYKLYRDAKQHFTAFYDDKGAIGRRYRRQDEAGTPFCITVDGDTVEKDDKVTVRDRDTLKQERVHKDQVVTWLRDRLAR